MSRTRSRHLREHVPAVGVVELYKPAEATPVVPASDVARVGNAAEKRKEPTEPLEDVDNDTGEQSKRMTLSDEVSTAAGLHVCAVGVSIPLRVGGQRHVETNPGGPADLEAQRTARLRGPWAHVQRAAADEPCEGSERERYQAHGGAWHVLDRA